MSVDWQSLHFAAPVWFWALLALPAVWVWQRRRRSADRTGRYQAYADAHLLPHLLSGATGDGDRSARWLRPWTALWVLGVIALAGPRWDFTEITLQTPNRELVVLLDVSHSMDVRDVAPSRLKLARREIEDLIDARGDVRIGLVIFASIAHTVVPITEDAAALRHLLPYLDPSLSQFGGSRLGDGLRETRRLFGLERDTPPEPGRRDVLLVSDGDFAESDVADLERAVAALHREGITVHVLAVGTEDGGDVPGIDPKRGDEVLLIGPDGHPVRSRLYPTLLQRLALAGGGLYLRADHQGDNAARVLAAMRKGDAGHSDAGVHRIWNERFPPLVALMLLLTLPWWLRRRRAP